jgi:hypothetical protein
VTGLVAPEAHPAMRPLSQPAPKSYVGHGVRREYATGCRTVAYMSDKRPPSVVARFEVVSRHPLDDRDDVTRLMTVDRSGQVRSTVRCAGEKHTAVTPWLEEHPPTALDLANALITSCSDDTDESSQWRLRLLSLVVHGLLPIGNHLEHLVVPDSLVAPVFEAGHTSYRVVIRKDVLLELRNRPELGWGLKIQTAGTLENDEFAAQLVAVLAADTEWLLRAMHDARSGRGPSLYDVVAASAPSSAKDQLAAEHPDDERPAVARRQRSL